VLAWYVPAAQPVHADDPVAEAYVPAPQLPHDTAAASENVPAAHATGDAVADAHALPAGQAKQDDAPIDNWYWPTAQPAQLEDAEEPWYWPVAQLPHTVAEASENVPAAHALVAAESPVVAQCEPAGQLEHAVAPLTANKVPAEQEVH